MKQEFQLPIKESREFFCPRTNVSITFARTKQPVKPVLQTKDTAVCVLQDLKENTVKSVSFGGLTPLNLLCSIIIIIMIMIIFLIF